MVDLRHGESDIEEYIRNLYWTGNLWSSELKKEDISYPVDGYNLCFKIEDNSYWFKNRNIILEAVVKIYKRQGPFFDVGGGNGYVTEYFNHNEIKCYLVEPAYQACKNATKRGIISIINSSFDLKHFHEGSIPNIGLFDVLEHIKDSEAFIETTRSILIQHGRLFITVPAYSSLWSNEDKHAGHFKRYSKSELERVLLSHGFKILYSTYFFSFLFLPVLFFRTFPSKLGLYNINQRKMKKQHIYKSFTGILFDYLMEIELKLILAKKSIYFGTSLLIVAGKE